MVRKVEGPQKTARGSFIDLPVENGDSPAKFFLGQRYAVLYWTLVEQAYQELVHRVSIQRIPTMSGIAANSPVG
jgi:hypothetical protein